jgi:hypothetical protein
MDVELDQISIKTNDNASPYAVRTYGSTVLFVRKSMYTNGLG